MSNVSRLPLILNRAPVEADPRSEGVLKAIRVLIDTLEPDDRHRVLAELTEMLKPISSPRAGDVLGAIVRILPRQKSWTVAALKGVVEEQGIEASSKEVYNAVGYLTRRGRIKRIGYGRYVVDGVEVVTSDDLGGERSITEEDLDN